MRDKKTRLALVVSRPGRRRKSLVDCSRKELYGLSAELQAGEHFAAAWIDSARGFNSCYWHALCGGLGDAVAATLQKALDADLRLEPWHFPTPETWNLAALLCSFAEQGLRPAVSDVLTAANAAKLDITDGAGDPKAELEQVLWHDSSAAQLVFHAENVKRFGELARQLKTTWRAALNAVSRYPRVFHEAETDWEATPIIVRPEAWRVSA